ncbi:hypothetical protein [Glutamicibacter sp. PS]|uniref:hypothetical protein n=1 Tax=Glutamicibacter sp. PS TaxID=3075634 RepID=UPI00284E4CD4|nr:hypothetical protein [Glutamicibacter sp. PS]MDR4533725.1 hypothetical protein [Glutamicibacter sp. PS]
MTPGALTLILGALAAVVLIVGAFAVISYEPPSHYACGCCSRCLALGSEFERYQHSMCDDPRPIHYDDLRAARRTGQRRIAVIYAALLGSLLAVAWCVLRVVS